MGQNDLDIACKALAQADSVLQEQAKIGVEEEHTRGRNDQRHDHR